MSFLPFVLGVRSPCAVGFVYHQVSLQNVAKTAKPGAFTGELCAPMVKDFGLEWVRYRISIYYIVPGTRYALYRSIWYAEAVSPS